MLHLLKMFMLAAKEMSHHKFYTYTMELWLCLAICITALPINQTSASHHYQAIIYHFFCNNVNFSSRDSCAIWTMVTGILPGTICLNIWQIRPHMHPGGKPLCSPHQHCKYTLLNDHIQQHFSLPQLIPHTSYNLSIYHRWKKYA